MCLSLYSLGVELLVCGAISPCSQPWLAADTFGVLSRIDRQEVQSSKGTLNVCVRGGGFWKIVRAVYGPVRLCIIFRP